MFVFWLETWVSFETFAFKIDGKSIVMKRRSKGENIVELTQNGLPSTWFVFTKEISISVSILQFSCLPK